MYNFTCQPYTYNSIARQDYNKKNRNTNCLIERKDHIHMQMWTGHQNSSHCCQFDYYLTKGIINEI